MEVGGNNKTYPGRNLSNFFPHPFIFRGFQCNSMEGFLQGLKFKSPEMQAEVFKLVGYAAKKKGAPKKWRRSQTLWFQGFPIPRKSKTYQDLLDEAYDSMYEQNAAFRKALADSGSATLEHSIGKTKESDTVLTIREFVGRLEKLRRGEKLCQNPPVFECPQLKLDTLSDIGNMIYEKTLNRTPKKEFPDRFHIVPVGFFPEAKFYTFKVGFEFLP